MEIQMGKLVRAAIEKRGMKKSEFAKRANITSQNVYDVFKRKSIDSNLLLKFSLILETNLFRVYEDELARKGLINVTINESTTHYSQKEVENESKENMGEIRMMKEKIKSLEKELEYLKEINSLLKQK